jgi:hypothetical protein
VDWKDWGFSGDVEFEGNVPQDDWNIVLYWHKDKPSSLHIEFRLR